jgi:hypothetical protein
MHELLIDPNWRLNSPADAAGAFAASNNIAGRVGGTFHVTLLSNTKY